MSRIEMFQPILLWLVVIGFQGACAGVTNSLLNNACTIPRSAGGCSCGLTNTNQAMINCTGRNFTEVPNLIPHDSVELYIANNNIRELKKGDFTGLRQLRLLDLSNNKITTISSRTFDTLTSMQELVIRNNLLPRIYGDNFYYLPKLSKVDLSMNRIATISGDAFYSLTAITNIELKGNPLSCECNMKEFKDWTDLTKGSTAILDAACANLNNVSLFDANLQGCSENLFESNLRCMSCGTLRSHVQCEANMILQSCTGPQPVCYTKINYDGGRLSVSKGCQTHTNCRLWMSRNNVSCFDTSNGDKECDFCCLDSQCNDRHLGRRTKLDEYTASLQLMFVLTNELMDPNSTQFNNIKINVESELTSYFNTAPSRSGSYDVLLEGIGMSLRRFLIDRGITEENIKKMEEDKIDVDIIPQMTDGDLREYLPCKGDRVAIQAFAREKKNKTEDEGKKSALIESLKNRMGIACASKESSSDDDFVTDSKTSGNRISKKGKKSPFFFRLRNGKRVAGNQSSIASKNDRALVVGFTIYDYHTGKYRQVRAPMGGGIRYPRVDKNTKKEKLLEIVRPLFFPRGKNCHGRVEEFTFDVSTDVRGTQLMLDDESVADIMTRLGLKHFRCYLLAKRERGQNEPNSNDNLPEVKFSCGTKEDKDSRPRESSDTIDLTNENTSSANVAEKTEGMNVTNTSDFNFQAPEVLLKKEEVLPGGALLPEDAKVTSDPVQFDISDQPVIVDFIAESPLLSWPLLGASSQIDIVSTAYSDAHESRDTLADSEPLLDETVINKTKPDIRHITVHRGLVCRDFINFFSQESLEFSNLTTFEIKMLKEDGKPEAAEDSGGVMRDSLTEFWDTFYLQYTEGNTQKVPVLRHDMTEIQWKAVAAVIKMGFIQEGIFPIKLALSFMQQAIFGASIDSELITSFLKFVSMMDKTILEKALKDFDSVDKEDIMDVMDQFEAKKFINAGNVERIVREIAHKELVQKPMFVADCFYKLLNTTPLVQEDLSALYRKLEPSPKKVLQALNFPGDMTQEETTLSSYVKKLVREMDDPQYLELFLRFCTGSDILTNKEIHVVFTSSSASNNVRCPSAHTCGCVLEIPRSYAQDPYVLLKSDFLSLLKNRYWQMDIV